MPAHRLIRLHAALLAALILCLTSAHAHAQGGTEKIVAVVGDKVFTTLDVRQRTAQQLAQLKQLYSGDELKAKTRELFAAAVDSLVNHELIFLDFKSLKNAYIPDSYVQEQIDRAIASVAGGDAIAFEEKLYLDGMTMKEYRERVFQDVVVELLLKNRVKSGISISDEAIQEFYDKNKPLYSEPPRYRLAVILLKGDGKYALDMDATCRKIQAEIAAGTPFGDLARQFSEDDSAQNGGDLGELQEISETLLDALRGMTRGMTTQKPVAVGQNRYFIRILDMTGGGARPLDEQLKKNIKAELEIKEQKRRLQDYLKQLNMKYPVKRYSLD